MTPTTKTSTIRYAETKKGQKEKKRNDDLNALFDELRSLVQESSSKKISHEDILFRVVKRVSEIDLAPLFPKKRSAELSRSSTNNTEKITNFREKIRRKKQKDSFKALEEFIKQNHLATPKRGKLQLREILQTMINFLQNTKNNKVKVQRKSLNPTPTTSTSPVQQLPSGPPTLVSSPEIPVAPMFHTSPLPINAMMWNSVTSIPTSSSSSPLQQIHSPGTQTSSGTPTPVSSPEIPVAPMFHTSPLPINAMMWNSVTSTPTSSSSPIQRMYSQGIQKFAGTPTPASSPEIPPLVTPIPMVPMLPTSPLLLNSMMLNWLMRSNFQNQIQSAISPISSNSTMTQPDENQEDTYVDVIGTSETDDTEEEDEIIDVV